MLINRSSGDVRTSWAIFPSALCLLQSQSFTKPAPSLRTKPRLQTVGPDASHSVHVHFFCLRVKGRVVGGVSARGSGNGDGRRRALNSRSRAFAFCRGERHTVLEDVVAKKAGYLTQRGCKTGATSQKGVPTGGQNQTYVSAKLPP